MVVMTVRPEPDQSWQTWGLALTFTQAIRLRNDLQALLRRCGLAVFLLGLLALTGCSARVHHERSAAEATGTEKSATEVEVGNPCGGRTLAGCS